MITLMSLKKILLMWYYVLILNFDQKMDNGEDFCTSNAVRMIIVFFISS
jgi:hypothetical protein